ncbi:MAG: hypothetical protein ACREFE_17890 [Limisphaerales bacterium]
MKSIRDYGVGRLLILGFSVGIIIAALRIAIPAMFAAVFHISASSAWIPFVSASITGAAVAIVVVFALSYFSRVPKTK